MENMRKKLHVKHYGKEDEIGKTGIVWSHERYNFVCDDNAGLLRISHRYSHKRVDIESVLSIKKIGRLFHSLSGRSQEICRGRLRKSGNIMTLLSQRGFQKRDVFILPQEYIFRYLCINPVDKPYVRFRKYCRAFAAI
jgi:hypothetical protein